MQIKLVDYINLGVYLFFYRKHKTLERNMAAKDVIHVNSIALEKQKKVVADIQALVGTDDPELLSDSIEGETMLFELVEDLISAHATDIALSLGIKGRIAELNTRKSRLEKRAAKIKYLLYIALDMAELQRMECPSGTISMKVVPAGYKIDEESEIPTQYFIKQDPVLDKASIKEFWKKHNDDLKEALKIKNENARDLATAAVLEFHKPIPGTSRIPPSKTLALRLV